MGILFQNREPVSIVRGLVVAGKFLNLVAFLVSDLHGLKEGLRRFDGLSGMVDEFHLSHISDGTGAFLIVLADIVAFRNDQLLDLISTVFDLIRQADFAVFDWRKRCSPGHRV